MDEKRSSRCCLFSHLKYGLRRPEDDVKVDLENVILDAIREGFRTFISSHETVVDIWSENIVTRLKDTYPDLKLILILREASVRLHADLIRTADDPGKWMVDHAARMIAVYNGSAPDTICYARRNKLPVQYLAG